MKEIINNIYGNQLRWFEGLQHQHQIYVVYAVLSAVLVLVATGIVYDIVVIANLLIALRLVKRVDGSGLNE